jgi:hypothetical protein
MQTEANRSRHLTQQELALRWNKSVSTIERYRSDGVGPVYLKIGGKVMYRVDDVEAYEQACLYANPHSRIASAEA